VAVNSQHLFDEPACGRKAQRQIDERRLWSTTQAPNQSRTRNDSVTKRHPTLGDHLRSSTGIKFSDSHTGRTDLIANPTSRTVINGGIRNRLRGMTKALGLRPDIFWAGEGVGYGGHGAGRSADVALNTVIERLRER
jgi:hypothetical protein